MQSKLMAGTPRQTRSNNPLVGFAFPSETPDRDIRRVARNQSSNMQDGNPVQQINAGELQALPNAQVQPAQVNNNDNEDWVVNPMIVDYNPGTRHGQEIFKNKTRGIPEAERFEVVSKEANSLRKLLISKSTVLGGIITRVPLQETPDANGNFKRFCL